MTLIIAGLGIKFLSHLTKETEILLKKSEKILFLTNDTFYPEWIASVNKNVENLNSIYFSKKKDRIHIMPSLQKF